MSELNTKILNAAKWSSVTEIIAKLITPITSIVLARLLTPEAFGVVATLTMVITFAEIFTDAGFQKYLIQHEFTDEVDKEQSTDVAFWSNLIISLVIWLLIGIFADPLAAMVGNPGLGHVLVIACLSIPLGAFSSIQMALYKRDLDFKTLFKVRIVGICIPLLVTVPLAFYLRSYWALVIGTIVTNCANAILLTIYSKWKPRLFYSFVKLKEMFSFSAWSVVEAVSIWLTGYIDVFIIGIYLNEHYLGVYKTSMTVVGQILGLITAATTPILFSSLSRLQDDNNAFQTLFFKFQKLVGLLVIPIGVGIYCYSDFVTKILLGSQWLEASSFIGLWGLTSAVTIVLSHYSSEVYRAKGRPKLSVLAQVLHLIVLWPAVLIAVKYGFEALTVTRSLIRLELILVNLIIMYVVVKVSPWKMFKNVFHSIVASLIMAVAAMFLKDMSVSVLWQIVSIVLCALVYFAVILVVPSNLEMLKSLIKRK
jgi:PST family polysaccharide transporter